IHYVKDADSDICKEIELSDGTFNYKPIVDKSEKPKIGSEYSIIDKCIEMYAKYAEKSGFIIRKSTQEKLKSGIPARKYLLYNKKGLPKVVNKDTMTEETSENQIRTGSIIRTGCLARAKFKINVTHTGYVLYEFEEAHNHMFVPKAYRNLTKKRKQMSHPEQIFVQQLSSTSIGATRAHHLYASTHSGYESVNAIETEYRNHKRDLNAHIGEGDAKILITKMNNRKLHVDNFSFEYVVENSQLSELFWADEMSKYNYKEFGDTVSFDATFRTNKYNMVFVPFTGIDNHRKCVTFGAGMLSNETTKSNKWLLTCFLKAFNNQPRLVITDQDPAMKNAITSVFNELTHRLCMWHIINKLPLKVSTDKSDGSLLCSCMNFARFGFLCRHIFCVFKGNGLEVIPDKYILKRWIKDLLPPHIWRKKQMFGFEGGRYMECSAIVYSVVDYCLKLLAKDEDKLLEFVENVKKLKTEVEEANPNAKQLSKKEMFNLVLGVEKP
nr:protein FAR1-related sequence 5-like [Tanacetum cinerariifolium]